MRYACANCGVVLNSANRSADNLDECADCGDFVWAYRPDEFDPTWFEIPEPVDGLAISGGQCVTGSSYCGLSVAVVRQSARHGWVARCEGQEWDGEWHEGCGAMLPIRRVERSRCVRMEGPPPRPDRVVLSTT